jgi:predicted amidohydrolase
MTSGFLIFTEALSQRGAQLLTVPAAFTVPTGKAHWEILLRARGYRKWRFCNRTSAIWDT